MKPSLPPSANNPSERSDEGNVDVGAIEDRGVAASVLGNKGVRDQLVPHVWRIADDKVGRLRQVSKQVIVVDQPGVDERRGVDATNSGVVELFGQVGARDLERVLVQFDRADTVAERRSRGGAGRRCPGLQEALDRDNKKVAIAERGFQQRHLVKRSIWRVTDKIENELNDLATREDRAAVFYPGLGEMCERFRHGTKPRQG